MRRLLYLAIAAAVTGAAVAGLLYRQHWQAPNLANATPSRPNVVLISVDTVRPDHLGCHGYGLDTTPTIDRLAARGVRFACARTQGPWTLPAHMSLFTSLLPSHNSVEHVLCELPSDVPTLARVLEQHGYNTAAVVNNACMKAHWGFHRGFRLWREYPDLTEAGDCKHLTDQALRWIEQKPAEPFFLFLHYFEPHDPYDPPPAFRKRFGARLPGWETSRLVDASRLPHGPRIDPELLAQLKAGYDGEIAWVDSELDRLFRRLPLNTVVVLFSDHGEAFLEHGVTKHGNNLFEEDVRVPLVWTGPGIPEGKVVNESVMLLDVAPTILGLCGVPSPPHYEGVDLAPLWRDERLPERPIVAETKYLVEGRFQKMVVLGDWKLIGSPFGQCQLYELPDEQTDRSGDASPMAKALGKLMQRWLAEEEYWIVYAHGPGKFAGTFTCREALVAWPLPLGKDDVIGEENDRVITKTEESAWDGRWFKWSVQPGGKTRAICFQTLDRYAPVTFDLTIDGQRRSDQVFTGAQGLNPRMLPVTIRTEDADCGPIPEQPLRPEARGFYIHYHRPAAGNRRSGQLNRLDPETIHQLQGMAYMR